MRTSSATCTRRTRPRCRTSSTCRTYLAHISPTSRPHLAHISPVQVPYVEYLPPHEQIFTCKVGYSGRNVSQARHFVDDGKRRYISRVCLAYVSPHLTASPLISQARARRWCSPLSPRSRSSSPPRRPPRRSTTLPPRAPPRWSRRCCTWPPYLSLYLPISPSISPYLPGGVGAAAHGRDREAHGGQDARLPNPHPHPIPNPNPKPSPSPQP